MYSNAKLVQDHINAIRHHGTELIKHINRAFSVNNINGLFWLAVSEQGDTYVSINKRYWASSFLVHLNVNHAVEYAETAGISDIAAAKALICHEIFHVLRDHFNPKYREYNHDIFNIAADIEVNTFLNLDERISQRASTYGFRDFLSADDYYHLLLEKYKDQSFAGFIPGNADTFITNDIFSISEEEAKAISEHINTLSARGEAGALRAAEVISNELKDTYEYKSVNGLKELINRLIREEHTVSIAMKSRHATYSKFNNRRSNGDIILPGIQRSGDGLQQKKRKSLTVFIDMSTSTYNINDALNTAAQIFHKNGATIAFYNGNLINVIKPTEIFKSICSNGATNISRAVREYMGFNKLERAYIITDGEDGSIVSLNTVIEKFSVFYIDNKKIRELCSNNRPIYNITELKRRCRELANK